jgi:hypothetical protein
MITTDNDGNQHPVRPVFLPPRDTVTAQQMGVLLSVARVMYSCVHPPMQVEEDDLPTGGATDGGGRLAAEQTFVNACGRIDAMLADASRWTMDAQQTLEKDMTAMLQAQAETSRVHQHAVHMTQLPQFKVRPLLVKLSSEAWVAYVGDLTDPNDSIVALGTFPQDAMNNFDRVYLGQASERLHQGLFDTILAQLKRTRHDIKNEIQVDPGTGLTTQASETAGGNPAGDSASDAEDDEGD